MNEQDWARFDVRARDAALAAHVTMWLRERLPAATIKSAPQDLHHQHLLHCSAAIPDRSAEQTERALREALRGLPAVAGPQPAAEVEFVRT